MSGGRLASAIVTNDDGIDSEGLRLLAAAAAAAGCQVLVAAPDREASGASAVMTATLDDGRVLVERRELAGLAVVPAYAVRAVPAFIALTAVRDHYLKVTMSDSGGRPPAGTDLALLAAGYASVTALLPVCEAAVHWLPWPSAQPAGPRL